LVILDRQFRILDSFDKNEYNNKMKKACSKAWSLR